MNRLLLSLIVLFPILSYSQKTQEAPPPQYSLTINGSVAPFKANGNNIAISQTAVDFMFPVFNDTKSSHKSFLKAGIHYDGLFLSGEKQIGSDNFHTFGIPLQYTYILSPSTNISAFGTAGVASDFKESIKGKDIMYMGGIRIGFHQDRNLKYGISLVYADNYSGKYLMPLPDIDWTINDKWHITGLWPLSIKYNLTPTQSLSAITTTNLGYGTYRVNSNDQKSYLHLQQFTSGLNYNLKLKKGWNVNVGAGYAFDQKLQTFSNDQKIGLDKFDDLNKRIPTVSYKKSGMVYQLGVSWAF